jgi:Uma2 family endonuclease
MATAATLMTAEEFWAMPRDGRRHELVHGEIVTMPPAGFEHGAIGGNLHAHLHNHVVIGSLGVVVGADTGFVVQRDPDTVRSPDIAFVGTKLLALHGKPKEFFPVAPDLAVEIVSPHDIYVEVEEKVQEWLDAGTMAVWVVNPRRKSVTVHTPNNHPVVLKLDDTLVGDPVLPGFTLPVRKIFSAV